MSVADGSGSVAGRASAAGGGVTLTFQTPTYTARGWPDVTDDPPPAREVKCFHVWRATTPDGPWQMVGTVDAAYVVDVDRAVMTPLPLTFDDPAAYDLVRETDRISVRGLAGLAPGRPLTVVLHHDDGSEDSAQVRHSLNDEQIGWFRAGSSLNVLKTQHA